MGVVGGLYSSAATLNRVGRFEMVVAVLNKRIEVLVV